MRCFSELPIGSWRCGPRPVHPLRTAELKRAPSPGETHRGNSVQADRPCRRYRHGAAVRPGAVVGTRRQRRISSAHQVSAEANLSVLGEITALPKRSLESGLALSSRVLRDRSTFEESVESLRVADAVPQLPGTADAGCDQCRKSRR